MSVFPSYRDAILSTVGVPMFVGNVFNLFLYGVLTVQFYLYYIYFPQDPRLLKTVVHLVYVTETVYTILLVYDLGRIFFTLPEKDFLSILIPVCGAIVAFLTQAMYAHRIRALGKLKYISWCIVMLIILELIVIIVMAPSLTFGPALYIIAGSGSGSIGYTVLAWASISLVIDVIIASAMVWSLKRNKIFSKQLKSKVTRLVYLVIGTGALTAIINLITVIFAVLVPNAIYGPAILLSKLYANSMMVFLNDRAPARRDRDGHVTSDVVTVPLVSLRFETATGPEDAAQEHSSSEGYGDVASSA